MRWGASFVLTCFVLMNPSRRLTSVAIWLCGFSLLLLVLLDYQSLWLDEVIQLAGTHDGNLAHIEKLVSSGTGGTPLGWLIQIASIHIFGYSAAVARLPSVVASIFSCFLMALIARDLGMRFPVLACILLSVLPLHFRYALEGRPYALGVTFAVLSHWLFIRLLLNTRKTELRWRETFHVPPIFGGPATGPFALLKNPNNWIRIAYCISLAAGIMTQPFTLFIPVAHCFWAACVRKDKRLLLTVILAMALMFLVFLPWYLYASPIWKKSIELNAVTFTVSWKTSLMLLREITGAGYVGGILLVLLASLGYKYGSTEISLKRLLVLCSATAIIGPLVADAAANYFVAIRQMIFALPPLVLLATDAFSRDDLPKPRRIFLLAAATASLLFFAIGCWRWLVKPREDFKAAARLIRSTEIMYKCDCTVYFPRDTAEYYALFEPGLTACAENNDGHNVITAVSQYATTKDFEAHGLLIRGKKLISKKEAGMTVVELYQ